MKKLFYLLFVLAGISAKAQNGFSINGKITDEKGGIVPGATVFLSNSKSMTAANGEGEFNLDGLQSGTYELVVKMLGFNPFIKNINIQGQSVNVAVKLTPNIKTLNEVVINAKVDPNRAKYLKMFISNFIGESANAKQCKILNPDVIKLKYDKNNEVLEAHSDDLIKIENRALGYQVNYLLTSFTFDDKNQSFAYEGKPYFEELKDASNRKLWEHNREVAYNGSIRHFFRALFNGTAEAEGFLVYRFKFAPDNSSKNGVLFNTRSGLSMPLTTAKSVYGDLSNASLVNSASLFSVIDNDFKLLKLGTTHTSVADSTKLFIIYSREEEPAAFYNSDGHIELPVNRSSKKGQVSQISPIKDSVLFDRNGSMLPANDILFSGYWTWERVADLMPFDYSIAAPKPVSGKLIELTASLDTFRKKVPIEKVHLQLDKPYYSVGDTAWVKGYVVNETNSLSTLSRFLYVDLINDKDSVKTNLRLPLTYGLGWGGLTLSDSTIQAGNYHIRAYTTLMRNLGEEYFFDKAVKIGNALPPRADQKTPTPKGIAKSESPSTTVSAKTDPAVSMQFFPEGGELVYGINSKVGFKAVGANGLGRDISGYIADQNNEQVVTFQAEHAGMGSFMLQPVAGSTYTAVVKYNDGKELRIELPKAKEQGYTLTASQNENNVIVSIQVSNDLLNKGEITLIAQAGNTIQYTGRKQLTQTSFTAIIPKSRFPEGILQFTLFSPEYKPVAERLVFIRNADRRLNIQVVPDKKDYNTRGRVTLNLAVTDQQGNPVTGSFSLAVTDEGKVPYAEADEKSIFSNLLLTSDLKGYIEHPNYYFTDVSADKDRQLDNLLLTQGWRRFVWNDLLTNTYPVLASQPEKGRGISGRVLTDKGKPVPDAKVTLLVSVGNGVILDTTANTEGRFVFDFPFSQGTKYNVTATDAKKSSDLKVEIDKQQVTPPITLKLFDDEPPADGFNAYLQNSRQRYDEMNKYGLIYGGHMLKEVKINQYQRQLDIKGAAVKNSQNLAGPGNADAVFTFVDLLTSGGQLGYWLAGRIPGVKIVIDKKTGDFLPYLSINDRTDQTIQAPMTLILDGVELDLDAYKFLNPDQISSIEILKGPSAGLYGMHGAAGVFIVTTKKGDVDYNYYTMEKFRPGSMKPQGLKTYTFQGGYDYRREFYSPDYDNPKTDTQIGDLRSTIYWNPNVVPDKDGKATIKFFNADTKGSYRIIAEGLNMGGGMGRQVYHYTVK